jgi:hypothetical protein
MKKKREYRYVREQDVAKYTRLGYVYVDKKHRKDKIMGKPKPKPC